MHRNRKKTRFRAEKLGISAQNVRKHPTEQRRMNSNIHFHLRDYSDRNVRNHQESFDKTIISQLFPKSSQILQNNPYTIPPHKQPPHKISQKPAPLQLPVQPVCGGICPWAFPISSVRLFAHSLSDIGGLTSNPSTGAAYQSPKR